MTAQYIALAQAIVIDTNNNDLRVTVGATTETVEVAAGTYYLSGPTSDNTSIFEALEDAIESHSSSPSITPGAIRAYNINGTAQRSFSWEMTSSVNISILWNNAATTFPIDRIGVTGTSTGTSHVNSYDPKGFWVSDQPPDDESKNQATYDVTQNATFDGGTYTFKRGNVQGAYSFSFDFIDPERVLIAERNTAATSSQHRTLEDFIKNASGDGVRVHKLSDTATPGTLSGIDGSEIDSNTFIAPLGTSYFRDFLLDETTLSDFSPTRFSAGLELYAFDIGMKAKRA